MVRRRGGVRGIGAGVVVLLAIIALHQFDLLVAGQLRERLAAQGLCIGRDLPEAFADDVAFAREIVAADHPVDEARHADVDSAGRVCARYDLVGHGNDRRHLGVGEVAAGRRDLLVG